MKIDKRLVLRKKKVLVLCPSPRGTAATQRLKYEQYLGQLEKGGYQFTISSFQTSRFWNIVYKPGRIPEKMIWTILGYCRRIYDLFRAPFYDLVFVNLWVTPLGLPFFERVLFFFNRHVVYDIDDMLFLEDNRNLPLIQRLKGRRKPLVLIKKARSVIVCTPKLLEIALKVNQFGNVVDISSTFNTSRFIAVGAYVQTETITLGWTGTHSTLPFLDSLQPVLNRVAALRPIKLLVIANKEYSMSGVPCEFRYWSEETEIRDLHDMQIGLYPIPANEWSLGKSSLKALTYMAVGIPFVATAYGTNFRIMTHGNEGFLASSEQEWVDSIIQLIDSVNLRRKMGEAGRKTVVSRFSVEANLPLYRGALESAL